MITLDENKRIIKNSKGVEIDYVSNLSKVRKQQYPFLLNDDLSWSKSLNEAILIIRQERDKVVAIVDCFFLSDTTKITTTEEKNDLKSKRQFLRDITENVSDIDDAVDRFIKIREMGNYFKYVVR